MNTSCLPRPQAIILTISFCILFSTSAKEVSPKVAAPVIPGYIINLADFGGNGDGQTLNTIAFQKAMAALSEKGGGTLNVPPGFGSPVQ